MSQNLKLGHRATLLFHFWLSVTTSLSFNSFLERLPAFYSSNRFSEAIQVIIENTSPLICLFSTPIRLIAYATRNKEILFHGWWPGLVNMRLWQESKSKINIETCLPIVMLINWVGLCIHLHLCGFYFGHNQLITKKNSQHIAWLIHAFRFPNF